MLGAIVGDIVGSIYEFNNIRRKDFELFVPRSHVTDDTIMTLAVAKALAEAAPTYDRLKETLILSMKGLGRLYPSAGYGTRFEAWIFSRNEEPYNSYGNGAAMRVSPVAYVANSIEEVKSLSHVATAVTHNHPEGIKGAEATAVATYMARTGESMESIRQHIEDRYYTIDFDCASLRMSYGFDESCQGTVPQALQCFFESTDFEDAIRNAISIGGDSDTVAAICGAVAGAYYGISNTISNTALTYMDTQQKEILTSFEHMFMK